MKKFIASLTFIIMFTGYALYQNGAAQQQLTPTTVASVSTAKNTVAALSTSSGQAAPPPKKPASVAVVAQGQYRNGIYTGSPADAYYGTVQVQVTVAGGKITDVAFLNYPQDRGTSRSINSYAMPQLTQEAIQSQSANVSGVSGASDTSAAFRQSLASALSQAA